MNITIPELSLVVLIGASGSGKSSFARTALQADRSAVVGLLPGAGQRRRERSGGDQGRLRRAALHRGQAAGRRAADRRGRHQRAAGGAQAAGRPGPRVPLPAGRHRPGSCRSASARTATQSRPDRDFGPHVVRNHVRSLRQSLRGWSGRASGTSSCCTARRRSEAATVTREPLYNNKKARTRAVRHHRRHSRLLRRTDGAADANWATRWTATPSRRPEGRKAVFLGDLVDRGPKTPDVLRLVMGMVAAGTALCVPGNHDVKLLRKLRGKDVQITHGLAETLAQLDGRAAGVHRARSRRFWTAWSATTSWTAASWSSPTPA